MDNTESEANWTEYVGILEKKFASPSRLALFLHLIFCLIVLCRNNNLNILSYGVFWSSS